MRKIRGLALGTYYAKGADAARATPNASQVRGLDKLLGASRPTAAFAVAVTDSQPYTDAANARRFTIEYDETADSLDVSCILG
jgi:hypothetical protein